MFCYFVVIVCSDLFNTFRKIYQLLLLQNYLNARIIEERFNSMEKQDLLNAFLSAGIFNNKLITMKIFLGHDINIFNKQF